MFHPGIPSTRRRQQRHHRQRNVSSESRTPPPKTLFLLSSTKKWILLPEHTLNYFQKSILSFPSSCTFTEIYKYIESFEKDYPENSMQMGFLYTVSKSNLPYEQIQESLFDAFYMNQALRWKFKKLLFHWISKHSKQVNTADLVTLEVPSKPVYLIDLNQRKKYVFESSTILKDAYTRIMNHDGLILDSKYPRNPYTNEILSFEDCIFLHNQLRRYGTTNWLWEAFARNKFSIEKLQHEFEAPMRLQCLQSIFNEFNFRAQELLVDFILEQYESHAKYPPPESIVYKVIRVCKNHPFVEDWISACKEWWTYQIRPNAFTDENQIRVTEKTRLLMIVPGMWVNLMKQK